MVRWIKGWPKSKLNRWNWRRSGGGGGGNDVSLLCCGHRSDIEKCNTDAQKDTKRHRQPQPQQQQRPSTNLLECTSTAICASHFSSTILSKRSIDAGRILHYSRCTWMVAWTLKSLIVYLDVGRIKDVEICCSSDASRDCASMPVNCILHIFNYHFIYEWVLGWMTQHSNISIFCHWLATGCRRHAVCVTGAYGGDRIFF